MRILVIGGGGREHALCWRLARDAGGHEVHAAPGNPGTAQAGPRHDVEADDVGGLLALCLNLQPDLVVVGPEAPLAAGIADVLLSRGFSVFGPLQGAARLESSKLWAKEVMVAQGIPTARYHVVEDQRGLAAAVEAGARVIKADGLAAGKGVVVAQDAAGAMAAGVELLARHGAPLLAEERVAGVEVSVLALCDGTHAVMLPSAQDHKRAWDGDRGPNTGGMGTLSPGTHRQRLGLDEAALLQTVHNDVVVPVLQGLNAQGNPFVGALFVGLMVDPKSGQMNILEFNARLGDPETQVLMRRVEGNLAETLLACARGEAKGVSLKVRPEAAACVVMAAEGYPDTPRGGDVISGLDAAAKVPEVQVFHAGTHARPDGALCTRGGRVLGVTAVGTTMWQALDRAYAAVALIQWPGVHYRRDLGRDGGA